MNDEINKLLREKGSWEDRIVELGGPDYKVFFLNTILNKKVNLQTRFIKLETWSQIIGQRRQRSSRKSRIQVSLKIESFTTYKTSTSYKSEVHVWKKVCELISQLFMISLNKFHFKFYLIEL